jgi:formylglycine-generating enzyme required for sulfatase activity
MSSGSGGGAPNDVVAIGSYDIDTRETTVAQYQAFLDSKPPIVGQPPKCSWNDSFEPATAGPCTGTFDLVSYPERPVVCIDWCDAVAYCTWRGRRLCGQIGGGQLAYADASDPAKSEWGNACTKGGALVYPYGNDYIPDACNTAQKNFGGLTEVATVITCVGGYEGLLDMSGNAEEWEDACSEGEDPNDPRDDSCHARGGAYWTDGDQSTCAADIAPTRNSQDHSTGIRCCGSL